MTAPAPDSASVPAHIRWLNRPDLPRVRAINARNRRDVWPRGRIEALLERPGMIAMVAQVGEAVVGYMLYELRGDRLDVLQIEVDPDYRGRGIMQQMVAKLAGKLAHGPREEILFHVAADDAEMVEILRRQGARAAAGAREGPGPGGGRAIELRYRYRHGDRPGGAAADAGPRRRPSPALPDRLRDARRKLTELTGVEWDVVKPDRRAGAFVAVGHAGDLAGVEPSDLGFRTVAKVADPAAAVAAVREFCGIAGRGSHAGRLGAAARVVIPASWLRPVHLQPHCGAPGRLADAFRPADRHARSGPGDEGPGRGR